VVVGLAVLHLGAPPNVDPGLHQVLDLHGVREGAVSDEFGFGSLADLKLRQDLLHPLGRDDAEAEVGRPLQPRSRLDKQFDPHAVLEFLRFNAHPRYLIGPQHLVAADDQAGHSGGAQEGRITPGSLEALHDGLELAEAGWTSSRLDASTELGEV
jgi:hypothetical protein